MNTTTNEIKVFSIVGHAKKEPPELQPPGAFFLPIRQERATCRTYDGLTTCTASHQLTAPQPPQRMR